MFCNPADYLLEIASGQHGAKAISDLIDTEQAKELVPGGVDLKEVVKKVQSQSLPIFTHTWILFLRALILTTREPVLATLSFIEHVFVALCLGLMYSSTVGQADGCYKAEYSDPGSMSFETLKKFQEEERVTNENIGFLFFSTMFLFLASLMATVMTFPLEMNSFLKETSNRWYTCGSYYLARVMADTPFRILYPILYSIIVYQVSTFGSTC